MLLNACVLIIAERAAGAAPSSDELAVGRMLFAEALDDEEHRRFPQALEKYKRVLQIRETASTHYRMGLTLEGMAKYSRAIDAHAAAVRVGTAGDAEVVQVARARIDALEPKVAHLALHVAPETPPDAEVRVDDERIPPERYTDVRLDPGAHVIRATAPGMRPFSAVVTLSEGGHAQIPVNLQAQPAEAPPPKPEAHPLRTAAIITGAAGGLLAIGGVVMLALRSGDISDLKESCPGGDCPPSREAELRATHDRASAFGPLGVTLVAAGAVALGTGIVLFTSDASKTSASVSPGPGGSFFQLTRTF